MKSTSAKIISVEDINKKKSEIIIDALIGYSLNGYPKGKSHELIRWLNEQLAIIISLDVPSGIDATRGNHSQYFVKPDLTLTLGLPKTGLIPELTGELYLGDIGIPSKIYEKIQLAVSQSIFNTKYYTPLFVYNPHQLNQVLSKS